MVVVALRRGPWGMDGDRADNVPPFERDRDGFVIGEVPAGPDDARGGRRVRYRMTARKLVHGGETWVRRSVSSGRMARACRGTSRSPLKKAGQRRLARTIRLTTLANLGTRGRVPREGPLRGQPLRAVRSLRRRAARDLALDQPLPGPSPATACHAHCLDQAAAERCGDYFRP
jgi:hypothetical protein